MKGSYHFLKKRADENERKMLLKLLKPNFKDDAKLSEKEINDIWKESPLSKE